VNRTLMSAFTDLLVEDQKEHGWLEGINKLTGDLIDAVKAHKETNSFATEQALHVQRDILFKALESRGVADPFETVRSLVESIRDGYYVWEQVPDEDGDQFFALRETTQVERAAQRAEEKSHRVAPRDQRQQSGARGAS
jgi:hypothetical protein